MMVALTHSVVICTYRREETLCQTLEDLLGQDCTPAEVLVVDQSPEHTPETKAFLERRAARLVVLRLERANLPNARNFGTASATGDVLVYIDDDIRLRPDFVGRLLSHFVDEKVAAVAPVVVDTRGAEAAQTEYTRRYGRRTVAAGTGLLLPAKALIGACFAVRRSAFNAVGGFDSVLGDLHPSASGEDGEFFLRIRARGYRCFVDPALYVLHLSSTPGGCCVRTTHLSESKMIQLRADAYIYRKFDLAAGRGRVWTWSRLIARHVLPPGKLRSGPTALRTTISLINKFVPEADNLLKKDNFGK